MPEYQPVHHEERDETDHRAAQQHGTGEEKQTYGIVRLDSPGHLDFQLDGRFAIDILDKRVAAYTRSTADLNLHLPLVPLPGHGLDQERLRGRPRHQRRIPAVDQTGKDQGTPDRPFVLAGQDRLRCHLPDLASRREQPSYAVRRACVAPQSIRRREVQREVEGDIDALPRIQIQGLRTHRASFEIQEDNHIDSEFLEGIVDQVGIDVLL